MTSLQRGLEDFKSKGPPPWLTGSLPLLPSLKVRPERAAAEIPFAPPFEDVCKLYGLAEQSQVGTTEETRFNLEARKSKEFTYASVVDQDWAEGLQTACEQVRMVLAPGATSVRAELHKVLLYQEGDFFKPHQDAQQSDRMFASLLFFLPVVHEGGEFKLWDEKLDTGSRWGPGGYRTIDIDKNDRSSWVAFYTDVRHLVEKVDSGFRVVLNYRLLFEGSMCPSPALPTFDEKLEKAFRLAITTTTAACGIAVPLRFKYTEATMTPAFLKGSDAMLYNALSKVCKANLRHVLKVDETEIIPPQHWDDEADWESVFDGLFLLDEATTKEFRLVYERHKNNRNFRAGEEDYRKLLDQLDGSYRENRLEWLAPRRPGFGSSSPYSASFNSRETYGWLGNMTPAAQHFYFDVVLVLMKD